jgi:tetratricopeptide (TPR) repeat protein
LWLGETESFPTELQKMRRDFPHVTRWRPPGVEYLIVAGWQDESETLLKESLDLMPSDAGRRDLYTAAARGYACIGDYGRAEAQLKAAAKYEVENARELRHQQTGLYLSQGRFEDAERVVRQMLARTPNDPRTLLDLAQVHLAAGNAGAARDVAGELLDAGTHGGRAYRTMALALADLGRYAEADAFARKALEMDPRREVQTLRAWVLISGDLDVERGVELARDA